MNNKPKLQTGGIVKFDPNKKLDVVPIHIGPGTLFMDKDQFFKVCKLLGKSYSQCEKDWATGIRINLDTELK